MYIKLVELGGIIYHTLYQDNYVFFTKSLSTGNAFC